MESEDGALLADLRACFDPAAVGADTDIPVDLALRLRPRAGARGGWSVETTPREAAAASPWNWPLESTLDVCRALAQWAVDRSTRCYGFHAGAVCRDGRAVLLPAASGSGKSTLTAALVQRGFGLLSDEVAAFEPASGDVVAFPRNLALRADVLDVLGVDAGAGVSFRDEGAVLVPPEALGGRRADRARVALVVVPAYAPDASTRLEPLGGGRAAVAMMECLCTPRANKVAAFERVVELARAVPRYRLSYARLEPALDLVERALAEARA